MYYAGASDGGFGYLGTFGASDPNVAQLQRALALLTLSTGDTALALKADGIVGPATTAAVNRALVRYATMAPASLRTGKLTQAQVKAQASTLASFVQAAAAVKKAVSAVKKPLAPAPAPKKPTAPPPPVAVKPGKSPDIARLQQALRTLGARVKDVALVIVADGMTGPRTAAAVNKAFTKYITAGAASYRTGRLTPAEVASAAGALASLVEQEAAKRAAPVKPPVIKPPKPAAPVVAAKQADILHLQQVLSQLGARVKDKVLVVAIDGLPGPKTTAAANLAMTKYVSGGPAALRTGKLSVAQVRDNAKTLATWVSQEVAKRGARPTTPPPPSPVVAPAPEALPPEVAPPAPAVAPASVPEPMVAPEMPSVPVVAPMTPTVIAPPPPLPMVAPPMLPAAVAPPEAMPAPAPVPHQTYVPSPMPAAYDPDAPMPPGAAMPDSAAPDAAPAPAAKKFPWMPVLIGVGVAGALGIALLAMRPSRPVYMPAPTRARVRSARMAAHW